MRRAGGPAGGAGAGPARGPAPAAARGWGGRAGKGGAKGKGEDGAGPRDPSPRRGLRCRRLIGPGRGGRGRGPLLGGRADWPRTLQCRHRRRAARDSAAQLRPGLRRAGGGRSQPVVVRGVRPGWGGGTSSRAREISPPWSGRPPSLPARSPSWRLEERPQLQSPRPRDPKPPHIPGWRSLKTHFLLKFHPQPPRTPRSVRPFDLPQGYDSGRPFLPLRSPVTHGPGVPG